LLTRVSRPVTAGPYTFNQYFAMMHVDEFKYIFTAKIQAETVDRQRHTVETTDTFRMYYKDDSRRT